MHVSVIIPTRDRPATLFALTDALALQSELDGVEWELVVVDDGSSPEHRRQCVEHLTQWTAAPVRHLLLERSGGVSAARNAGVRAAAGQLLIFFDDDVVPASDCVARYIKVHADHPEVAVVNGLLRPVDGDYLAQFWHYYYAHAFNRSEPGPYPIRRLASGHFSVKRRVLDSVSPLFDESLPAREDLDLYLQLEAAGIRTYKHDGPTADIVCRDTLLGLIRQRIWYEKGEVRLAQKHGVGTLRAFYAEGPWAPRSWKFLPVNLVLWFTRRIARLLVWTRFAA